MYSLNKHLSRIERHPVTLYLEVQQLLLSEIQMPLKNKLSFVISE